MMGVLLGKPSKFFSTEKRPLIALAIAPPDRRVGQLVGRDRLAHAGHGAIEQQPAHRLALLGGITGQIGGNGTAHGVAVDQDLVRRHPTLFHQIAEHGAGILVDPLFAGSAIARPITRKLTASMSMPCFW